MAIGRRPSRSAIYAKIQSINKSKNEVIHSGSMFRKLKDDKLKKYWFELRGSVLYCFRASMDGTLKNILLLIDNVNLFQTESGLKTPNNEEIYSFKLIFGSRDR